MARNQYTPDCEINKCSRAQHKAGMCTMHYGMVPEKMRRECAAACMTASHFTARKHHRKMLALVRKQLRELVAA
jgi:hypothetical protein